MATHFSCPLPFPVYALGFLSEQELALGGGGGAGRSGIKNRLAIYRITVQEKTLQPLAELELSKDEDAPMTAVIDRPNKQIICGINGDSTSVAAGQNKNLRIFDYSDIYDTIGLRATHSTLNSKDSEHYQKVTALSRDGKLLAIGGTNGQLSLFNYPDLTKVFPCVTYAEGKEELYDVDFNDEGNILLGASSSKLCIWATDSKTSDEPLQTIERPVLKKDLTCVFRAAKFGRQATAKNLYTVVNTSPAVKSRTGRGGGERKAFVSIWDTQNWALKKTRTVSQRQVTSFDISESGALLGFGSADLSISVFDSQTLRPLLSVLRAHDFPVTALKFSPESTYIASGSADNTVRIINIDKDVRSVTSRSTLQTIAITLLVLLLAVLAEMYLGDNVSRVARNTFRL